MRRALPIGVVLFAALAACTTIIQEAAPTPAPDVGPSSTSDGATEDGAASTVDASAEDATTDGGVDATTDGGPTGFQLPCGVTRRVSVATDGTQANADSQRHVAISADGRYVAFMSLATNLVPNDINGVRDIFVHDLLTQTTERVSVASDGTEANAASDPSGKDGLAISNDGRYVAFVSSATNLVTPPSVGTNVFVRDRVAGTTELANVTTDGNRISSTGLSMSGDGRYLVFSAGPVYVRDRMTRTTKIVSIDANGDSPGGSTARISNDGTTVVFASPAKTYVNPNGVPKSTTNVFVTTWATGPVEQASPRPDDAPLHIDAASLVTGDGNEIIFRGHDSTSVTVTNPGTPDEFFVYNRTTKQASRFFPNFFFYSPQQLDYELSANGRYFVVSTSFPRDPAKDPSSGTYDIYTLDRQTSAWSLVTRGINGFAGGGSSYFRITPDGSAVAFISGATNLVADDINGFADVFVARGNCP